MTKTLLTTLLVCTSLAGCISPKSFVDPSVAKVSYDQIQRRENPLKLKVLATFLRNGEAKPKLDAVLKSNAEKVLNKTSVVTTVNDHEDGTIQITINNIADTGAAAAKGFGTGLTFGLAGTTVMDAYEMNVTIHVGDKTITRTAIKDALYTAIGNATLPPDIVTTTPSLAFGQVVKQMLLQAVQDMQKTGELALRKAPVSGFERLAGLWSDWS